MDKLKLVRNIVTGFVGQFIIIILGLIIPRLFIDSYGSDVNGLISTIAQIFTYMALLEAGIGAASQNALYKPLREDNKTEISEIISVTKEYFKKFTFLYGFGVILLALGLPFLLKTNVDSMVIFLIVLLEGMSGVISFYFVETTVILLNVDGKSYVNNTINLANKIIGYIVKIVMAILGINIVILQLAYFLITVVKVIFYEIYFRKNYSWVRFKRENKKLKLKDRNSYILTEVCWTIFSSTDMIVLSMFVSTQLSSVYAIYNMIFTNITLLVNAVYMSIVYVLGYTYHESIEKYSRIHDSFNSIFIGLMTVLMSVCYVLTIPFVELYTHGVADINYLYTSLPIMFCLIQLISWSRYVSGNLTGIAGYAKQTSYVSLIEALTNLILSIVFVKKLGIVGVTLATVIALPVKVVWCTYVADKKVMHRSYGKSVSIIGINFLFFIGVILVFKTHQPIINSYGQFFIWGVLSTVVFSIIGMGLNFLVNKECWNVVRRYILKR